VSIVPFAPRFDEFRQNWYVDVRINVPSGYFPLARLAVVRLQRNAILGSEGQATEYFQIPPVTLLDPVPLLPDRELEVRPIHDLEDFGDPSSIGGVSLELRGVTYSRIRNREGADDTSPPALAKVTARAQVKLRIGVDGSTGWRTVAEFPLARVQDRQAWKSDITFRELRGRPFRTKAARRRGGPHGGRRSTGGRTAVRPPHGLRRGCRGGSVPRA
jgi:hypothetical protein